MPCNLRLACVCITTTFMTSFHNSSTATISATLCWHSQSLIRCGSVVVRGISSWLLRDDTGKKSAWNYADDRSIHWVSGDSTKISCWPPKVWWIANHMEQVDSRVFGRDFSLFKSNCEDEDKTITNKSREISPVNHGHSIVKKSNTWIWSRGRGAWDLLKWKKNSFVICYTFSLDGAIHSYVFKRTDQ